VQSHGEKGHESKRLTIRDGRGEGGRGDSDNKNNRGVDMSKVHYMHVQKFHSGIPLLQLIYSNKKEMLH
jgi:hypothetical protein